MRLRSGMNHACDAMRLLNGESDGLPGLTVDHHGELLVLQLLSAGAESWSEILCDELHEPSTSVPMPMCEYWKDYRCIAAFCAASCQRSRTSPCIVYAIASMSWLAKTGFYPDQRSNRQLIGGSARGADVLNCFYYTGGFSLVALRGDARSVLSVDSSSDALDAARVNLGLNGLPSDRAEWVEADVFQYLRRCATKNEAMT
jgi:23S rRNA (cytosine1962-C5)-methyltransferase